MYSEMTDAELERLWAQHRQGQALPSEIQAQIGPEGPELVFVNGHERHSWSKRCQPLRGSGWKKVLMLG